MQNLQNLHPKAVWLFFFRYIWWFAGAGFVLGVGLGPVIGSIFSLAAFKKRMEGGELSMPGWIWGLTVLVILIFIGLCYIWARLSWRFWRYQLTEEAYKSERGVIFKRYVSIPYERIQNIDIYRGILDRILGLSDLQIQTAGYGAAGGHGLRGFGSEGRLPGLDRQTAENLRDELIKRAKGKSGV